MMQHSARDKSKFLSSYNFLWIENLQICLQIQESSSWNINTHLQNIFGAVFHFFGDIFSFATLPVLDLVTRVLFDRVDAGEVFWAAFFGLPRFPAILDHNVQDMRWKNNTNIIVYKYNRNVKDGFNPKKATSKLVMLTKDFFNFRIFQFSLQK